MKIAHYNTHASGGSAVLMQRLHDGLLKAGVDSRLRYKAGTMESKDARCVPYATFGFDRFMERARYSIENRMLRKPPRSYFSRMVFHRPTELPAFDRDCDIIHLHWVSRWLDLPSFVASIPVHVPIIWSIHDMSPLAGGCFLDFGCEFYGKGCGRCPLLLGPFDRFLASNEVRRRRAALAGREVMVIANSDSTRALADRSEVFDGFEKVTIHPGLDLDSFKRLPKHAAKQRLGIDPDSLVLGFGAASLTDPNKGLDRMFSVARDLAGNDIKVSVLLFGDGAPLVEDGRFTTLRLGSLREQSELSLAYSAMDLLIVASEMETFGQVSVEAQACGTPVWAFRVGGVPETMEEGVTGCLIPFPRMDLMGASIRAHFQGGRLPGMGYDAYKYVRRRFSATSMIEAYLKVYSEVLHS